MKKKRSKVLLLFCIGILLSTQFLSFYQEFRDEKKVEEFLNYIKENYNGYKIVYVDENGNEIKNEALETENDIAEESIMMTENTVDGYVTKEVETNKMTSGENKTEPYIPTND